MNNGSCRSWETDAVVSLVLMDDLGPLWLIANRPEDEMEIVSIGCITALRLIMCSCPLRLQWHATSVDWGLDYSIHLASVSVLLKALTLALTVFWCLTWSFQVCHLEGYHVKVQNLGLILRDCPLISSSVKLGTALTHLAYLQKMPSYLTVKKQVT